MVATEGLEEYHLPPVTVDEYITFVAFEHISLDPLKTPVLGAVVIVIVLVALAVESEQAPVPVTAYVMVEVPPDTGVIKPVEEFMVATEVLDEDHIPPEDVDEKVVVVLFEQIF